MAFKSQCHKQPSVCYISCVSVSISGVQGRSGPPESRLVGKLPPLMLRVTLPEGKKALEGITLGIKYSGPENGICLGLSWLTNQN